MKLQIQREEEILLKIKQKMDRIKANQQKFQPAIPVGEHAMGSFLALRFSFTFLTLNARNERRRNEVYF